MHILNENVRFLEFLIISSMMNIKDRLKELYFMKRLVFFVALLWCPTTVFAEEVEIGNVQINTCKDVTYLQAVDITVGENCLRMLQASPSRTLFELDDTAQTLVTSWAMPYAMQAPTFSPVARKKLAIIDTGFTTDSAWLQSFITKTYNATNDTESVEDTSTHGTAVATAAILAMREAPVDVIIIKIDKHGQLSIANIVKGINYAIEEGADVINLSLGGTSSDEAEAHAIQAAIDQHITVVAAAGNNGDRGNRLNYPASYKGVLSIGAMNAAQARAAFSNYNDKVTFVAPGEAVPLVYQHRIQAVNGTSFASPFAAAIIASVAQYSDAATSLLHRALIENVADLGAAGYDIETGYGVINSKATLHWLRGKDVPMRTLHTNTVTVTFSKALDDTVELSLYQDAKQVEATQSIHQNVVTLTPTSIDAHAIYTLKIDRDVRSVLGDVLTEPMYVPLMFDVSN